MLYLGTHRPNWLGHDLGVPLFLSRRWLAERHSLPRARQPWALDSGGFTELSAGRWSITRERYVDEVHRFHDEIGMLQWAAPMDWMCEPSIRAETGLRTREHQHLTLENFAWLRDRLGPIIIPVLQGWEDDDYLEHLADYADAGYDLRRERLVGVGSICRRNADDAICRITTTLAAEGLRLHGFGVRGTAYQRLRGTLESADSMAWSFDGRYHVLEGCQHASCANCQRYALRWYQQVEFGQPSPLRARRVFQRRAPIGQETLV